MITKVAISIWRRACSEELFASLKSTYAQGASQHSFHCELLLENPLVGQLVDVFAKHGKRALPHQTARDDAIHYSAAHSRVYDDDDCRLARYLHPVPVATIGLSMRRSKADRLLVKRSTARSKITLAAADWAWLVVSDKVRRKMVEAGLKHVVFKEVETAAPIPDELRNQIWELSSDLTLPAFSPKCELVNIIGGTPFTGDRQKAGFALVEGLHSWPEFHYTASAIQSAEPFDLAHTFERWHHDTPQPKFVASQRFYQFCKTHEFKMKWAPVRIDPD